MKKIIRQEHEGIIQITCADERWYQKAQPDGTEIFVPSVTWITSFYPKGVAFYKWLANTGWDESQAIKEAAADKGSAVHRAIVDLIDGKEIRMDAKYPNTKNGELSELTLEEYEAIMSFTDWWKENNPDPIAREVVAFNDDYGYAGTVDFVCNIGKELYIIDFKTSQSVWPEFEIQVSAYKHALAHIIDVSKAKLGILQLGYRRNKKLYKFTEIEDKFDLFLNAKAIWANETKGVEPKKKDYPESLCLNPENKK